MNDPFPGLNMRTIKIPDGLIIENEHGIELIWRDFCNGFIFINNDPSRFIPEEEFKLNWKIKNL